jgi:hypothetical protein
MSKDKPTPERHSTCPDPNEPPHDAKLSHPVGTGVGAVAGGAAAGAAIGSIAGPIGTAVGAAAATLAGAVAGREIAEKIDDEDEEDVWCELYGKRTDVPAQAGYDDYRPAYRYGAQAFRRSGGRGFEEVEPELAGGWDAARTGSRLPWDEARSAARDAWERARERGETKGLSRA